MYVVSKRDIQIFLDPDTKEPYEAESYILTNRQRITWDHKSQSWRDRHGKEKIRYTNPLNKTGNIKIPGNQRKAR